MGTVYALCCVVIYNNLFFNLEFVFENIKSLRPYFHSLREIQDNVSLDIKLPLSWKYEDTSMEINLSKEDFDKLNSLEELATALNKEIKKISELTDKVEPAFSLKGEAEDEVKPDLTNFQFMNRISNKD